MECGYGKGLQDWGFFVGKFDAPIPVSLFAYIINHMDYAGLLHTIFHMA
jgi:hypothetical protein